MTATSKSPIHSYLSGWTKRPIPETLAGMVSTFALIPEVIAFSYISGITPSVALFSTLAIACTLALFGGRPGMISGAAGSVALVAGPLVHKYGVSYLVPATLLCGAFQVLFGICKLQNLTKLLSNSVIIGFLNALGILIFSAQVPEIIASNIFGLVLIALGLLIIYGMPYVTKNIPSPLIAIAVLSFISIYFHWDVKTIGDLGKLPDGLPSFILPNFQLTNLMSIIALPAIAMAFVGLIESLMTAEVVQKQTNTKDNLRQETIGLGLGNIASGLIGGIAGCGMIGQTVSNIRYGGIGRLSILMSGVFLITLMILFHKWLEHVPLAALLAIMIMVSISTFSWKSIIDLPKTRLPDTIVMMVTLVPTLLTKNLALGVALGVITHFIVEYFYPSPTQSNEGSDI